MAVKFEGIHFGAISAPEYTMIGMKTSFPTYPKGYFTYPSSLTHSISIAILKPKLRKEEK